MEIETSLPSNYISPLCKPESNLVVHVVLSPLPVLAPSPPNVGYSVLGSKSG